MRLNPLRPKSVPRRRRRFSLNALAIQLSAFALSFTLVALLVVSGSQAAFVEENEVVAEYAANATPPPPAPGRARPARGAPPEPAETPPAPAEAPPAPEPAEEPAVEVPAVEVQLTDSDAGTAMFGGDTLIPGVAVDRCIEVSYAGQADPGPVRLYAAATAGDLAPYLDLSIDLGLAGEGVFGGCGTFTQTRNLYAGTLADFAFDHPAYAFGVPTWDPSAAEATRSFRFRLELRNVPAAAGKSATFGFVWRTEAA